MFDVKCGQRGVVLMQLTILASVLGALANLDSGLDFDHLRLRVGEVLRLAFKNGDELIRSHVSCVLSSFVFSEFAFS